MVSHNVCQTPIDTQYSTKNLAHKAASGSLAEEVLSTVRTCKAFGMGRVFGRLFEGHVEESRLIGFKIARAVGAVTGAMCASFRLLSGGLR